MKILHLSAVKNWGGGENHIENLCFELDGDPEVENVVLCARDGLFHQRLEETSIRFFTAALKFKMDPAFIIKIGVLCREQKIDLIHIHDTTALSLAVMADYFYKLPHFIFSKKTSFPIKNRKQTLHKYNYPKIKKVLCVSETTKAVTSERIADASKLTVIYHGTRLDNKSSATPFALRDKFNVPENHYIVGNIANHIRAKHLETWIEVADVLVNEMKRKDIFFVQMGNFTKRTAALQEKVQRLNLQDNIKFLGFTANASNYIPQFDLSLITSQSEGIPQVIYESFYHAVPVVSTRTGGIPEIIEHNENGLLADIHDAKDLAEHILILLEDRKLQERFVEVSRKLVLERFSTKKMAQQTLKEYQDILQKSQKSEHQPRNSG